MTREAPIAEVVEITRGTVIVRCPLCGDLHVHPKNPGRVSWEHRAPACGAFLNPDARELGYRFQIPNERG